jgi:glycosyltransferase involved in cell wall biosynthesis
VYRNRSIGVIIPALDEEESLPAVLGAIPRWVDRVVVVDNGSSDATAEVGGDRRLHPAAMAVRESRRGYGSACLRGLRETRESDIIVFLDADGSDDPGNMAALLDPLTEGVADVAISNRFTDSLERGALTPAQSAGNRLAVFLIRLLWGYGYRDLGPFRSVTQDALRSMALRDRNYGWTVELQVRACECRLRIAQIDVPYRRRQGGRSKVSGTVRGTLAAGTKILLTIFWFLLRRLGRSVLGWPAAAANDTLPSVGGKQR